MPSTLLANQPLLIQPTDLPRYSMSSDFLAQFAVRPLQVQIVAGGSLGTMSFQWQQVGDPQFGKVYSSEAAPPWQFSLDDPGFGLLVFSAGTYNQGDIYSISTAGVVTGGTGGGIGLVSATRYNVMNDACIEATSLTVTWLKPRCVPPITAVGPQIQGWMGDLVNYRLRSRQGMVPPQGGAGDDNVRLRAKDAEREIKLVGASEDRPPDIVDSSTGNLGAGFAAYPAGDDLRGW